MATFRLLEHTADIGICAFGSNRKELVEQCGYALHHLLYGTVQSAPRQEQTVRAHGGSPEETLVNWLNELLFLLADTSQLLVAISVENFSDSGIDATVTSEPFDPERHSQQREIKAVTHHQTQIIQISEGRWQSTVYLDL